MVYIYIFFKKKLLCKLNIHQMYNQKLFNLFTIYIMHQTDGYLICDLFEKKYVFFCPSNLIITAIRGSISLIIFFANLRNERFDHARVNQYYLLYTKLTYLSKIL